MSSVIITNDKNSGKRPLKLMIVEDQTCLSHLYYVILDKHITPLEAHIFHELDAGKDAIQSLKEGYVPDFAILDIRINGINGIDVWRELTKTSKCPAVFLTAMSDKDNEFKEACFAVGKENVIKKDSIRFFEDLMPKIPNLKEYLRCNIEGCLKGKFHECPINKINR